MKKKLYSLEHHPLFSTLPVHELEDLNSQASILYYSKNRYINFEAREESYLYGMIKGRAKVLEVDCSGNQLINEIVREGDIFGDPSFYNAKRTCYAQSAAPVTVIFAIPSELFNAYLKRNAELSYSFSQSLEKKLRRLQNRYHNLVFHDVKSRLLSFFREWALAEGNQFGQAVYIANYLTHSEIANLICSSRQSVTTILNKLKSQGDIKYSRYQIVIPDMNKLFPISEETTDVKKVS